MLRLFLLLAALALPVVAQPYATKPLPSDKFRQLEELLPTPGPYRNASGAPGHAYWQQRADYVIDAELDDATQSITGKATMTYHNLSPDSLGYLWLQLDVNIHEPGSDNRTTAASVRANAGSNPFTRLTYTGLETMLLQETYSSNLKITAVTDANGAPLPHTIVKTMMRVDLPAAVAPQGSVTFSVSWSYTINNAKLIAIRSGWEFFPEDGNYLYEIAQWFPRFAAYNDTLGWQHKQYLGRGEFTLEFGDYLVRLTVPSDHIVTATGQLQNPEQVLTAVQRERLKQAETSDKPVFIVTPAEAKANEQDGAAKTAKAPGKKTWIFKADNVRDFAFATSRKFIWDAMGAKGHTFPPTPIRAGGVQDRMYRPPVMAMSFYPNDGEPLWSKYSTHAIAHTLDVYSKHTFAYPYPVAISVNGPIGGMEYPMICFNGPRPDPDGTYTDRTKYGLISVIIHEVGHNYFPMIVNSDERQWTWMDEGLNSFLQFLAEQTWEKDYPSRRGEPRDMISYMVGPNQVPIMTNSESIAQLGPNAYGKPATALNVLRESVLGRELFDHAFKVFSERWMFKRHYPADFFRTMEDASAVYLYWFWRGWFYTNDHVDVAIEAVREYTLDTRDHEIEKARDAQEQAAQAVTLSQQRNADLPKRIDAHPELADFYNDFDEATVLPSDRKKFEDLVKGLERDKINPALLRTERNYYVVDLVNIGGLVTPVPLKVTYQDGSTEELRIPAEVWRIDSAKTTRTIMTTKQIVAIQFDPHEETADADLENNYWPRRPIRSKFQLFQDEKARNPMREVLDAAAKAPQP